MPYAQWRYPFENQGEFERQFPADFICEAIDQTRGWFYTLHAEATLLKAATAVGEGISYRNVISHGHILDEQGEKMSKSRGNAVGPWDVINETGADALRWYIYVAAPTGSSRRFSTRLVNEGLRRFQLTLWNTYSFFVTYANIDGLDPRQRPADEPPELDRWVLSELNALNERVTTALDAYNPTDAARAIDTFVDDLSNWYVRRSRRRFWRGVTKTDTDKRSAYYTLYTALVTLTRLLAPFMPFLAETLWQNLVLSLDTDQPDSVHLADWPGQIPLYARRHGEERDVAPSRRIWFSETLPNSPPAAREDLIFVDEALLADTRMVKRIASMGRATRARAGVKVRQPLTQLHVAPVHADQFARLDHVVTERQTELCEELNVKIVLPLPIVNLPGVKRILRPNLKEYGSVWAADGTLQARREAIVALANSPIPIDTDKNGQFLIVKASADDLALAPFTQLRWPSDSLLTSYESSDPDQIVLSEGGLIVNLYTEITPELADEGLAREIVRRVQDLRREAGFELSDRITTWCQGDDAIARVIEKHRGYLQSETLTTHLIASSPDRDVPVARFTIDGHAVTIAVQQNV